MPLAPGTLLGPYEILAPLGKGGMGEVYKARDTRLNRDVAVKTSATQFSERFEREARAIAALNHPNICTLYDVGPNYLVMEYVEGAPIKGPYPLPTALTYARQISSALEAAHEKAITHRDLKPGNIMLTPEGVIKVLDFGLAKFGTATSSSTAPNRDREGADEDLSPTLTMGGTIAGTILGTAAYMSPEQARGIPVDKRADIWAFGVVLHEILTGERLFKGQDLTETIAAVVMRDPDLTVIPHQVRRLLNKCLQKEPKNRLRDIGDVWALLDSDPVQPAPAIAPATPASKAPWAIAAVALLAAAGLAALHFTQQPTPLPVVRFEITPPEGVAFAGNAPRTAISPDGTQLAFNATQNGKVQMWVRRFDSTEARVLPGTEDSETPFWSSDSKTVGFRSNGKLRRVDVASGTVQVLCDAPVNDVGGSWSPDGQTILFSGRNPDTTIQRVAASGGSPTQVLKLGAQETYQRYPRFLPDGQHFLYHSTGKTEQDSAIMVASLQGGEPKRLIVSDSFGEFAGGYLFYRSQEALVARPFDPAKLEFTGEPVQVAASVSSVGNGRAAFSVSANGYLALNEATGAGGRSLIWTDRTGKQLAQLGAPGGYANLRLSPDNRQLAFAQQSATQLGDIWIYDLAREVPTRMTFDVASDSNPVWTPDGRTLLFWSDRKPSGIYTKPASGLGDEQLLIPSTAVILPQDVSPDGKLLLISRVGGAHDIFAVPLDSAGDNKGKGAEIPLLTSIFDEFNARFSPDGRWIAYASNEAGPAEIYVRSFPGNESKIKVSNGGGLQPRWRRDGKELYYIGPTGNIMAIPIKSLAPFEPGTAVTLFPGALGVALANTGSYAVTGDGSRFLRIAALSATNQTPMTILQNWPASLKK